jgi:hypothetical protein
MKVEIPKELKSDMPQTTFAKILAATPVVMAVVATMLAGLASSEMTNAQYDRSLAAQQQSKAGDQWNYFQAKKLRGAFQRNTAELLQAVAEVHPLDVARLKSWAEKEQPQVVTLMDSKAGQEALNWLQRAEVASPKAELTQDPKLQAALAGIEKSMADRELMALIVPVNDKSLNAALKAAQEEARAFDEAIRPINQTIDQLEALVTHAAALASGAAAASSLSVTRAFTEARMRYGAGRYEAEARLNQSIANLYELQVRKSNFSAERHHARSQKFFFGMLGAQLGVIVSTFAMAARNRNLLWSLAAAAGLIAITFAIYVYLYV